MKKICKVDHFSITIFQGVISHSYHLYLFFFLILYHLEPTCDPFSQFACSHDQTECIEATQLCDGNNDCSNNADEKESLCNADGTLKH